MALDGLEQLVIKGRSKKRRKLNIVRYADDFIITGADPDYLQNEIKPDIERFLAQRGLTLSVEKTKLSHIDDGFNFLGFNVRKFNAILLPIHHMIMIICKKCITLLDRCTRIK